MKNHSVNIPELFQSLVRMLSPEWQFYGISIVYGVGVSVLTLAVPISVQMLINTIANVGIQFQLNLLAGILLILLLLSCGLFALQTYVMEMFERRFYVRIVTDVVAKITQVDSKHFRSINRTELINRYFDIMSVQKNVSYLLTAGIAIIFQTIVGLAMVSFYHPALLSFTIFLILTIYIVLRIWWPAIIQKGVSFSSSKYSVAKWLEEIAQANSDFKSDKSILFGLKRSTDFIQNYISARKSFFTLSFRQRLSLMFIYSIFSASLLGLGGLLVIKGELSLGQLVAAELIMSAILYNVSRLGQHLEMVYELLPAIYKLTMFYQLPAETSTGIEDPSKTPFSLKFLDATFKYKERSTSLSLVIPVGHNLFIGSKSYKLQGTLIDLLLANQFPEKGQLLIDDSDSRELNPYKLRDRILVINDPHLIETSIEDYLKIGTTKIRKADMLQVLEMVELDKVIKELPEGLKTTIISTGYPLSTSQALRLKLANALLRKPSTLVLSEQFDIIGFNLRFGILKQLCDLKRISLIYFSNHPNLKTFNYYLLLDGFSNPSTNSHETFLTYLPQKPDFRAPAS